MNYKREWRDSRNAVGFAAECARLALPFYDGDRRFDVIAAIEIAEVFSRGEQINSADARTISSTAFHAAYAVSDAITDVVHALHGSGSVSGSAADAATRAADAACYASCHAAHTPLMRAAVAKTVCGVARDAIAAGVSDALVLQAFTCWVVKDLNTRTGTR